MTDEHILHDLQREIAGFAAARIDAPVRIERPKIARILLARDGSDQDATATAVTAALAANSGAPVKELSPPPAKAADVLLAEARSDDLLVLPCPFGADYEAVGSVSLAPTLDVLLARSPCAMLLVRGPIENPARVICRPLVILQLDRHRKVNATCWAIGVAGPGGDITLLSVVDPQHRVERAELLGRYLPVGDLAPEVLLSLAGARAAALVAALQRGSRELHIEAHLKVRVGALPTVALEAGARHGGLLVGGLDRQAPGEARALVLASELPVLLV